MYNKKMEKQTLRTNKLQKMTIFLLLVFVANFLSAQSQQLKTYTDSPSSNYKISYTGYEDELGNITKHGTYTIKCLNYYKGQTLTGIFKFENGVLNGPASITLPNVVKGNIVLKNGEWLSIDYTEGVKGQKGYLRFKYSKNNNGLFIGDFEIQNISSSGATTIHIKGQFDTVGKATGWWSCVDNTGSAKLYYEQGIRLGSDESTIAISRDFFINKTISEKELNDKGYYVVTHNYEEELRQRGGNPNDLGSLMVFGTIRSIQGTIREVFGYQVDELKVETSENTSSSKTVLDSALSNKMLAGTPISYMSDQLYNKIKTEIEKGVYDNCPRHDELLNKYYVLKADKTSRLYLSNESQIDFVSMMNVGNEYIDLGLPSGTKWKGSNELNPNNKNGLYNYIDAVASFGKQLPTEEQFEELRIYCKWTLKGNLCVIVGPNGKHIILPAEGYYDDRYRLTISEGCYYWISKTSNHSQNSFVYNEYKKSLEFNDIRDEMSVRLVK